MTHPLLPSSLLGLLFSSAAMRTVMSDKARLQRMLDVEYALAAAEARLGVIPKKAIKPIGDGCVAERYDIAALGEAAVAAGNIAIPLVKALTAEVMKRDADSAGYVHWGATSQDIIDTALVLDLRAAIDALVQDLDRAIDAFSKMAITHRKTPAVARTWLQHALPMPFGLKAAGYAAALSRSRERLKRLRDEALLLQFGGAAGTLASLGKRGFEVAEGLSHELKLPLPDAPWHSHRDRLGEVASAFAILAGSCGKIARDMSLLMQTEICEVSEPAAPGRGGSSTMPHKRNPVACAAALACAQIAPHLAASILAAGIQEHERSAGNWASEWVTFPALALVTSGALAQVVDIAEGLEIDPERMRANLDITHGLIMAEAVSMTLAEKVGKDRAHTLVEDASKKAAAKNQSLKDVLLADTDVTEKLSAAEIEKLFDPIRYSGVAQIFIDRLLAAAKGAKSRKKK
ncbi:MAG TPA: 3-carboxy-cis,cis-muconate cycloisomerase [Pseudorhodoplanes sp.]|nr:3-carboxy-cis,cis-muconate cycloisomerase [Pseudorhodoplanes sp.]